ncbi:MAG: TolC family protein [Cyanobacteriota/Melainabacteria group bacterium]
MVAKVLSASSKALALTALVSLSINSIVLPAIAQDSSDKLDLRPPIKTGSEGERTDDLSAFDKLEDKDTILIDPEKLIVKPPVLKALIKLDQPVSPLHIEADGDRDITLGEVLKTALRNNLDIKISDARKESAKWRFYEDLSRFLPDVVNSFSFQAIQGKVASPAGAILRIKSPYLTTGSGFNWTLFKGGERIFRAKEGRHRMKASVHALKGSVNDVLLQATNLYYELVLNDALLQIRVKAVEESKAILQLNEDLFAEGVATKLDVLQSRTQLSRDRQALVSQQIKRRQAAVDLATALYIDPAVDLNVQDRTVRKIRLIAQATRIGALIGTAIKERPELPKMEERRLAALQMRNLRKSAFLPSLSFNGAVAATGADIARGDGLQQIPLSSVTSAGSTLTPSIAGGANAPLANGIGGGRKTFDMRALFVLGMDVEWTLGGLGVTDTARVKRAGYTAREAQLAYNKELAKVYQEVRNSYNHAIDTEALVKETTSEVDSSEEALRIAVLRLKEGLGTQTDIIIAQRDYTQALINKVRAIVDYNKSQAQVLHSVGAISFNTLTRGFRPASQN